MNLRQQGMSEQREQRREKGRRRQDHPWDPTVTKESSSEPCVPTVAWVPS